MNGDIQSGLAGFGRGLSGSLSKRWSEERAADEMANRDTAKALRMMKEPKPLVAAENIRAFIPDYVGPDQPDNLAAAGIGAFTRREVASGNQAGEDRRAKEREARARAQMDAAADLKDFEAARKALDPQGYGYGQDPVVSQNIENAYNKRRMLRGKKPVKLQQTIPGKPGSFWGMVGKTAPSVQMLGGEPTDADLPPAEDGFTITPH